MAALPCKYSVRVCVCVCWAAKTHSANGFSLSPVFGLERQRNYSNG